MVIVSTCDSLLCFARPGLVAPLHTEDGVAELAAVKTASCLTSAPRFRCVSTDPYSPGLPKKRTPGACQKGSRAFSSRFGEGRFFPGNKNSFSHPAPKKAFSPPTTRGAFLIQHRGRPFLLPRPHPFFVLSFKNLATPRSQERNPRQPMRHGGRHPRDSSRRSTPTPSEAEHLLAERSAKGRRHSSRRSTALKEAFERAQRAGQDTKAKGVAGAAGRGADFLLAKRLRGVPVPSTFLACFLLVSLLFVRGCPRALITPGPVPAPRLAPGLARTRLRTPWRRSCLTSAPKLDYAA